MDPKYDDEGGVEELRHGRGHGPPENVTAHISVCEQRQGSSSLLKACPEDNVDDHENDQGNHSVSPYFSFLDTPASIERRGH